MLRVTKALEQWLVKECGAKESSTKDEFVKAAGEAFASGKLSPEKYVELTKDAKSEEANQFAQKLDQVATNLEKLVGVLTQKSGETDEEKAAKAAKEKADKEAADKTAKEKADKEAGKKQPSRLSKMFSGGQYQSVEEGEKDIEVRVKEAAEMYSDTKTALHYPRQTKSGHGHPFAGQRVKDFGRELDEPSERDKAIVGAFGKFLCACSQKHSKTLAWMGMNQHDKELILYAMENHKWCGASDGGDYADIVNVKLTPIQQKALIDDAVSGGVEAVPLVFDDMVVATPILQGEFFPLVNLVPLDKGRRIQGARAGIVTSEWGGIDDTSVTLFDTASYVTAFDTTIYRWQGSIWIGLDFLSDTPIDFAQFLTQQYGEVMLRDMDSAICVGNGTTQPEGIMVKSGTTSVAWGGATSIGNYESLRFGVHKREHLPNMMRTAVFGGTDISYQRANAIPVGASDARRLKEVQNLPDYDGYTWMQRPYKINESLTNSQIFYAILGRYRMYRRRGLTIRNSVEGDTLIRRNEMLMVAMARFGGQLERGAAAAVTSTAPA